MLKLSDGQRRIMRAAGNLLVLGGPGSGKTTVAILKAGKLVRESLQSSQKIVFLSFARSTVARIVEALDENQQIGESEKRLIQIDTYHAFFWRLIRSHGYLLGLPRAVSLLTPTTEAIALSAIRMEYPPDSRLSDVQREERAARESAERARLAQEEGRICFDLFADLASQILHGSRRIRALTSEAYPFVVLDEFQDTDEHQWRVLQALGEGSEIIALADPEQRIYDFIGADPERLDHYREALQPSEFDLAGDNHRSGGTHIAKFGNDVLKGRFGSDSYDGISVLTFPANRNQAYAALKVQVFQARERLIASGKNDWSLAILVPTKKMTGTVSDYLRSEQAKMAKIQHSAVIDVEPVVLAAEVIAFLLQPRMPKGDFEELVQLVCSFYEGRGGDAPSKAHLALSRRISVALAKAQGARALGKPIRKNSLIVPMLETYEAARAVKLSGDPDADWLAVRAELDHGPCSRLKEVAVQARNLRLLDRGTQFRAALSESWRASLSYADALETVRRSFVQEYFASAWRPETGVIVMNMHKAKGKQFDEVIIFEGWPVVKGKRILSNPNRIVRGNSRHGDLGQARQNLRVSITRAKRQTTILTPKTDPCVLLKPSGR